MTVTCVVTMLQPQPQHRPLMFSPSAADEIIQTDGSDDDGSPEDDHGLTLLQAAQRRERAQVQ